MKDLEGKVAKTAGLGADEDAELADGFIVDLITGDHVRFQAQPL